MNATTRSIIPLLLLSAFAIQPSDLLADGGTVRLSQRQGGYRITVFTAPTPFRAGPVDISVLVQDAATGQPVPEAHIPLLQAASARPDRTDPITRRALAAGSRQWGLGFPTRTVPASQPGHA